MKRTRLLSLAGLVVVAAVALLAGLPSLRSAAVAQSKSPVPLPSDRPRVGDEVTWRVSHADGRFDERIELVQLAEPDGELFLSSSDLADLLEVSRFWRPDVRKLVLRIGDERVTFTVGARAVATEKEAVLLRHEVVYHEGEPWIPLEFLTAVLPQLTDRSVDVDAEQKSIRVGARNVNVTALEIGRADDGTVLRLRLREPLAFRVDDSRVRNLVVKIYGGLLDPNSIALTEARGLVDAVRSQQSDDFALVEVQLSELAHRYQSLAEDGGKTIVLRIEEAPMTLIPDPVPRGPLMVQTLPPEAKGREVNVRRVIVDPGHGGSDEGAVGRNGLREKDVTLAVALELERILERRHDIDVVLTRTDDSFVGLVERTELANREGGDVFISLHCNAWADPGARGVETYFLSPAKSEWDAGVARKENSGVSAAEDLDFILWDLVQNVYIQESATLAEAVQNRMANDLGMSNRGVKQAGFRVLVGAFMPAILVELGFVTHRDDASRLADDDWQREAAQSLADAVVDFRARMDALRERSR